MKIPVSGWYVTREEDSKEGLEYIGEDIDELAEWMDNEGELIDTVKEWAVDNYDFEDFIDSILNYDSTWADRDDIISEWKESIDESDTLYVDGSAVEYYEEGDEVSVFFLIDEEGEVTNSEDEDEEDEDEEDEDEDEEDEDEED